MDPAVIVTLVVSIAGVIFASITAPLILAHRTERMHREDQLADYRRQDIVARAAAAAAEAANIAAATAQRQAAETGTKIDDLTVQTARIHTLVNSEMTAARQEELDQAETVIVVLERTAQLTRSHGLQPDPADVALLAAARRRRDQLEAILADRLVQFHRSQQEAKGSQAGRDMLAADVLPKPPAGEEEETGGQ